MKANDVNRIAISLSQNADALLQQICIDGVKDHNENQVLCKESLLSDSAAAKSFRERFLRQIEKRLAKSPKGKTLVKLQIQETNLRKTIEWIAQKLKDSFSRLKHNDEQNSRQLERLIDVLDTLNSGRSSRTQQENEAAEQRMDAGDGKAAVMQALAAGVQSVGDQQIINRLERQSDAQRLYASMDHQNAALGKQLSALNKAGFLKKIVKVFHALISAAAAALTIATAGAASGVFVLTEALKQMAVQALFAASANFAALGVQAALLHPVNKQMKEARSTQDAESQWLQTILNDISGSDENAEKMASEKAKTLQQFDLARKTQEEK